jgi:hypothetical protein
MFVRILYVLLLYVCFKQRCHHRATIYPPVGRPPGVDCKNLELSGADLLGHLNLHQAIKINLA